jgi:DNA polymerase-3 subunit gamma/tau
MTYLPLARKYRPQTFDELIGQPHVTATLTNALQTKRLGQAYLFTGQRGVGKTSAARILAKCLNCAKGPTATPCNACASCTQITTGSSLDVLEIDGASNRGIEEIRNLRQSVPFAPTGGSFRVYIIDEVHMLTTEAFNALLKTLEEPPAHVKFIFATTAANKVPATILSRCQRFDFRRLEAATIAGALRRVASAERLAIEEPALYAIARAADGGLRDAEVILEQLASFSSGSITEAEVTELVGALDSEHVLSWAQAIIDRDAPRALGLLLDALEQGKDVPQLLGELMRHTRNLLVVCSLAEAPSREEMLQRLIDEPQEWRARLETQAQPLSAQELLVWLQMLSGAYELVRRSPMAQTILELVVIKLATREAWQSLDAISRRLEQLSAAPQVPSPAPPAAARVSRPTSSEERPAAVLNPLTPPVSAQASMPHAMTPMIEEATAPAEPAPPAPNDVLALWPVFLERLGTQKMSLAAYLAESRPLQLKDGLLTIGLPGFALHQEVLSVADHRRLITRLLGELCQASITVEYTTLPDPGPSSNAAGAAAAARETLSPAVEDIVKLFNATVLRPPPQTT